METLNNVSFNRVQTVFQHFNYIWVELFGFNIFFWRLWTVLSTPDNANSVF
jgi:hypothetical protein